VKSLIADAVVSKHFRAMSPIGNAYWVDFDFHGIEISGRLFVTARTAVRSANCASSI